MPRRGGRRDGRTDRETWGASGAAGRRRVARHAPPAGRWLCPCGLTSAAGVARPLLVLRPVCVSARSRPPPARSCPLSAPPCARVLFATRRRRVRAGDRCFGPPRASSCPSMWTIETAAPASSPSSAATVGRTAYVPARRFLFVFWAERNVARTSPAAGVCPATPLWPLVHPPPSCGGPQVWVARLGGRRGGGPRPPVAACGRCGGGHGGWRGTVCGGCGAWRHGGARDGGAAGERLADFCWPPLHSFLCASRRWSMDLRVREGLSLVPLWFRFPVCVPLEAASAPRPLLPPPPPSVSPSHARAFFLAGTGRGAVQGVRRPARDGAAGAARGQGQLQARGDGVAAAAGLLSATPLGGGAGREGEERLAAAGETRRAVAIRDSLPAPAGLPRTRRHGAVGGGGRRRARGAAAAAAATPRGAAPRRAAQPRPPPPPPRPPPPARAVAPCCRRGRHPPTSR